VIVSGVTQGKQCVGLPLECRSSARNYVNEQHYQRQDEQYVNKPAYRVTADNTKQPEHQQNNENCPKHPVILLLTTTLDSKKIRLVQKQSLSREQRPCQRKHQRVGAAEVRLCYRFSEVS
jgi:hypothetical protein